MQIKSDERVGGVSNFKNSRVVIERVNAGKRKVIYGFTSVVGCQD